MSKKNSNPPPPHTGLKPPPPPSPPPPAAAMVLNMVLNMVDSSHRSREIAKNYENGIGDDTSLLICTTCNTLVDTDYYPVCGICNKELHTSIVCRACLGACTIRLESDSEFLHTTCSRCKGTGVEC